MIGRLPATIAPIALVLGLFAASPASAVSACGGVKDSCKCGKNNPYPCCENGSNCTWWAWHSACCNWGIGMPGWSHAKTWRNYALGNPNYVVMSKPAANSIAVRTLGTYGHVAWVKGVSGGNIHVSEMNCCGKCHYGMRTKTYAASYFNGGFIVPKGHPALGPKCGDGKCEKGETCAKCAKDCGSCCGNGKCDNGETCGSCNKDCKCPPGGKLTGATCAAIDGWAQDPDNTGAKLQVKVLVDGKVAATLKADGNGPKKGHSFSWAPKDAVHGSKARAVEARAKDSQTSKEVSLGKASVECRSDTTEEGLWTTTRSVAGGITVALPQGTPPRLALSHRRAKGSKVPIAGLLESCVEPGLQPFERMEGGASVALDSGLLSASLRVDGEAAESWTKGAPKQQEVAVNGPKLKLCLRTETKKATALSADQHVTLSGLRFQREGWWYSYNAAARGMAVGVDTRTLTIAPRAEQGQGAKPVGAARLWRRFDAPFTEVSARVVGHSDTVDVNLLPDEHAPLTGGNALPLSSDAPLQVAARHTLALQVKAKEGAHWQGGEGVSIQQLRVRRRDTSSAGPWHVRHESSWNLDASVPAPGRPDEAGRALQLGAVAGQWWTHGQATALLHASGRPFTRVRGELSTVGDVSALRLDLVAAVNSAARGTPLILDAAAGAFEAAVEGRWLRATVRLHGERPGADPEAGFVLRKLAWQRQGWWVAPSANAARLRVDVADDGALALLATDADGGGTEAAKSPRIRGFVQVERALPGAYEGLRVQTRAYATKEGSCAAVQDGRLSVALQLGEQRVVLPADRLADGAPWTISASSFQHLALSWSVAEDGVTAGGCTVELLALQVQDRDGAWHDAGSLPRPQPISAAGHGAKVPGDGDGGCAAGPAPRLPAVLWLLAILSTVALLRRRRARRLPPSP